MILPLHHCAATRCLEMLDPDEFMCCEHWPKVSVDTMANLVCATTLEERDRYGLYAVLEVAAAEGLIHSPPDASQASNPSPVSPSAAGIPEGKS